MFGISMACELVLGDTSTYPDWVLLGCQRGALFMHCQWLQTVHAVHAVCTGCQGLAERSNQAMTAKTISRQWGLPMKAMKIDTLIVHDK
jgi:hypothetical protein